MNKLFCMLVLMLGMFFVSCKDDDNNSPTSPIDNTQNQDTTGNGNTGEEYANPDYKTLPNLPMDERNTWIYMTDKQELYTIISFVYEVTLDLEYKGETVTATKFRETLQNASTMKAEFYNTFYFEYKGGIFKIFDKDVEDYTQITKAEFVCPKYWVDGSSFSVDGVSVSVFNTEITRAKKKYHAQVYKFYTENGYYESTFAPGFGLYETYGDRNMSLHMYVGN